MKWITRFSSAYIDLTIKVRLFEKGLCIAYAGRYIVLVQAVIPSFSAHLGPQGPLVNVPSEGGRGELFWSFILKVAHPAVDSTQPCLTNGIGWATWPLTPSYIALVEMGNFEHNIAINVETGDAMGAFCKFLVKAPFVYRTALFVVPVSLNALASLLFHGK